MPTRNNKPAPGGVAIQVLGENTDITSAKQIWKGPPKIGKTTTAAALRTVADEYKLDIRPFFLLFEPGSEGVSLECTSEACPACDGKGKTGKSKCSTCGGAGVVRLILTTRKQMREWFTWFAESDTYNIAVIDTGDRFYQAIMDDTCVELKIVSPYGANDNGIAWSVIFDEMRELLGILEASGKGIILIMHCYTQEKRVRGGSIQQLVFNVPGKAKTYLAGFADQVLHFDVEPDDDGEDRHVLIAEHRASIEAGDRWGMFPPVTMMGETPEDAAEAMLTCFGYLTD